MSFWPTFSNTLFYIRKRSECFLRAEEMETSRNEGLSEVRKLKKNSHLFLQCFIKMSKKWMGRHLVVSATTIHCRCRKGLNLGPFDMCPGNLSTIPLWFLKRNCNCLLISLSISWNLYFSRIFHSHWNWFLTFYSQDKIPRKNNYDVFLNISLVSFWPTFSNFGIRKGSEIWTI